VDISGGMQQSYTEDCQVCCRPNVLYVHFDEDTLDVEIQSDYQE
ncbi:MAG: CPXCG motif-containing cysteine-rich protein, partial [Cyanobacteria bacterium J06633_1]